jgi:hypothetical protein
MAEIRVEPRRSMWPRALAIVVVLAVAAAIAYYFLVYRAT